VRSYNRAVPSRRDSLALAVLAALPLWVFWRCLRPDQAFLQDDLLAIHYPLRALLLSHLESGEIPSWNPWIFGGFPFTADPHAAAWYPVNRLMRFVASNPARHITLYVVFHVIWSGLGVFVASRRWLAPAGATAAGLVWALNGFTMAHAVHPGFLAATAWTGWIAAAVALGATRHFGFALAGVGLAMAGLAGNPQAALLVALLTVIWTLAIATVSGASPTRMVGGLIAAGVLAFGLAAIQILPTLELAAESFRTLPGMMSEQRSDWGYLLRLFAPFEQGGRADYRGASTLVETVFFVGITAPAVAVAGWLALGRRARRWSLVVALVGLWLTLGVWGAANMLPPGMRAHERYFLVLLAPLAVGVGVAVDRLEITASRWWLALLFSIGVLAPVFAITRDGDQLELLVGLSASAGLCAALLVVRAIPAHGALARWAVVALLGMELAGFGARMTPPVAMEDIERSLEGFRAGLEPADRFVPEGPRSEPWLNVGAAIERVGLRGFHPLAPGRYVRLIDALDDEPLRAPHLTPWPEGSMALLDAFRATARVTLNEGTASVQRRRTYSAFRTPSCRPVDGVEQAIEAMVSSDDPRPIVEAPLACDRSPVTERTGLAWTACGNDCWDAMLAAGAESDLVVLPLPPYPGWEASLNGRPVPLFPVNVVASGLEAAEGGRLRLLFRPASRRTGALISGFALLTLFAWLSLAAVGLRRDRSRAGRAPR